MRARVLLTASLLLLTAVVATTPVSAAPSPDVGCGADVVEVCVPVCVTEPCHAYACVHVRPESICQRL